MAPGPPGAKESDRSNGKLKAWRKGRKGRKGPGDLEEAYWRPGELEGRDLEEGRGW